MYKILHFVICWLLKAVNWIINFNVIVFLNRYIDLIFHSQVALKWNEIGNKSFFKIKLTYTNPDNTLKWNCLCSIEVENKRKLHNWILKCKMSIFVFILFNPSSQTMMSSWMFICQVGCLVLILHRNVIYFRFYI